MIKDDIVKWKARWGRVFKVRLEGQDIYYRPLTAGELSIIKDANAYELIPQWVILNGIRLTLAGSFVKLTNHVIEISDIITDADDLRIKAIQNRDRIRKSIQDSFVNGIIINLPIIYPCYTPDMLKEKTLSQLLEIVAMAEVATGKELIRTGAEIPTARPEVRDDTKFEKPDIEGAMVNATESLKNELAKYGKKAPTFSEVKKKTNPNLTDLQRQMRELSEF